MDIFTTLANTCIKMGAKIFQKPLERRLAPERRKARYLLRLYENLSNCHDSYVEWKDVMAKLREYANSRSPEEKAAQTLPSLKTADADEDEDEYEDEYEDKDEDEDEDEERVFGSDLLDALSFVHNRGIRDVSEDEVRALGTIVGEEMDLRLAWEHSINRLHETLLEGRSFLEIHNEKLADALFAYDQDEDTGFVEAGLCLDPADLKEKVPTGDFERARSLLAAFVKKHTKHEDFF